jgi:hypothetical protein
VLPKTKFFFSFFFCCFELKALYGGALSLELLHQLCMLGIFEIGSHFCCLSWPQTSILLISLVSDSQVARIVSINHQCLTKTKIFPRQIKCFILFASFQDSS